MFSSSRVAPSTPPITPTSSGSSDVIAIVEKRTTSVAQSAFKALSRLFGCENPVTASKRAIVPIVDFADVPSKITALSFRVMHASPIKEAILSGQYDLAKDLMRSVSDEDIKAALQDLCEDKEVDDETTKKAVELFVGEKGGKSLVPMLLPAAKLGKGKTVTALLKGLGGGALQGVSGLDIFLQVCCSSSCDEDIVAIAKLLRKKKVDLCNVNTLIKDDVKKKDHLLKSIFGKPKIRRYLINLSTDKPEDHLFQLLRSDYFLIAGLPLPDQIQAFTHILDEMEALGASKRSTDYRKIRDWYPILLKEAVFQQEHDLLADLLRRGGRWNKEHKQIKLHYSWKDIIVSHISDAKIKNCIQFCMKEGLIAKDLKGELFHLAASQGNEETMEFLVKSNPASYNKESASAMLRDVCKSPISDEKSLDLIKTLCNQGADVYAIEQGTKESTLTLAASKGKVRVIEFLLGKKMDIHQTNSENQTALELICKSLASDKNTRAIVDQLISKGAQISSLNLDLLLEKPLTRDLVEQRQKR